MEYTPADIVSDGIIQIGHRLKEELEACGIICKKLSEDQIWERLKKRSIDRYTAAIKSFILKCRKYWLEPDELAEAIKEYTPLTEPERLFNALALHFYRCYLERIEVTGEDDFDGLMQKATLSIESGNTRFDKKAGSGDLRELRYIFIDEFQDFSEHFWRLTDAIRKQNPAVNFFCVGDDWQAINGFAGSDLKFFSNFSHHFDNPSQKYIATNYRSAQKIVNVGNVLMGGLGKPARPNKEAPGEVACADLSVFTHTLQERQRHNTDKITPAVTRLVADALNLGSSVVLLSRTNRLPYYLSDATQEKTTDNQLEEFLLSVRSYFPEALQKRITISTAHKYKGLEKQTVIILDAFDFQREKEEADKKKKDLVSANIASFNLMRMANSLLVFRKQAIDPFRGKPTAFLEIPAFLHTVGEDININAESLYFLLETEERNLLAEIIVEERRYVTTIHAINERSTLHRNEIQPLLETAGVKQGGTYSLEQLEQALGERMFITINMATDQVVAHVDETITSIQAISKRLADCMKTIHPDEYVTRYSLPE